MVECQLKGGSVPLGVKSEKPSDRGESEHQQFRQVRPTPGLALGEELIAHRDDITGIGISGLRDTGAQPK